jgi:hypothetical protein
LQGSFRPKKVRHLTPTFLKETVTFCDIFYNPPMFNIRFGAGAIRAEAASRYGSIKMMRLLAAPSGSGSATLLSTLFRELLKMSENRKKGEKDCGSYISQSFIN